MNGRYRAPALAALGGATFALTAPPLDFYPAVFIGLGLLFAATEGVERARAVALVASIWATTAGVIGLRFVPSVIVRFTDLGLALGLLALVLLALLQSSTWALGLALARLVARRTGLDARLAFGLGVTLALSFVFVIAWSPAGLLAEWPSLLQLADLVGEKGLSFFFALASALLATPIVGWVFRGKRPKPSLVWLGPALGAVLLGSIGAYGHFRLREVAEAHRALPTLRVGVVQAAVEARMRWEPAARDQILRRLRHLTAESERSGAALTIWPEAAYPYVLDHSPGRMPRGARRIVGAEVTGPVLFGLLTRAMDDRGSHNSAAVVSREGLIELPQAKLELLAFGEAVPLGEYLPFLKRLFARAGGLVPGKNVVLQRSGPARIGVLNCYEDTLAPVGREVARERPNLLVNVTNDAWFGRTAEPELHLRLSVLRAIEARRDLVRAVNLGVPAWIDAAGVIRQRGSSDAESVMMISPALNDMSPTPYVRAGDIPLWLGLALAIADAFLRRRRRRAQSITARDP